MCDKLGYREEGNFLEHIEPATLEDALQTMAVAAVVEEPQELPQEFSVDQIPTGFGRYYYQQGLRRGARAQEALKRQKR